MRTLRMLDRASEEGHGGEVFGCAYSSDGAYVLSGGWDGRLHLWVAKSGQPLACLQTSLKPLSACAFSSDGTAWVCGDMDGVLSWWDAVSHQRRMNFTAHIRPISAIQFSPDGRYLATASWDRKLLLRRIGDEQDGRHLPGHRDIVAGCRWSADGKQLISWSYDGTLRLWDPDTASEVARLDDHADRVTGACLSRDGQWAASGGRDGKIKLWDLRRHVETRSMQLEDEVRVCWFLDNDRSLLTVTADGRIVAWSLPDLEIQTELVTGVRPLCGDLAPSGTEIVLGTETGHLHFISLEIPAELPLQVTATPKYVPKSGVITRFLGKPKVERCYQYTCPACGYIKEITSVPDDAVPCPGCERLLRISLEVPQLQAN